MYCVINSILNVDFTYKTYQTNISDPPVFGDLIFLNIPVIVWRLSSITGDSVTFHFIMTFVKLILPKDSDYFYSISHCYLYFTNIYKGISEKQKLYLFSMQAL